MSEDNNQTNGTSNGDVPEIELIIKVRMALFFLHLILFVLILLRPCVCPFGHLFHKYSESFVQISVS